MNIIGNKDTQTVTSGGKALVELLSGVSLKEMPNIITKNGITTEVYRKDWNIGGANIEHIIHVFLRPNAVSAWHCHHIQTDHFFVTQGSIRLVLFDNRDDSPTKGRLNLFHLSRMRPMLVTVPPYVWHGIQNLESEPSAFINFFDRSYCYEDPDEWRLPINTTDIPYSFS
jgi:dTDP-4-dehydrorhamnose 3,5-epimerase